MNSLLYRRLGRISLTPKWSRQLCSAGDATSATTEESEKRKKIRKFMPLKDNRPIIQKQRKVNEDHEARAAAMKLPWRIVGATVMHRYPTILPEVPQWEKDFVLMTEKMQSRTKDWLEENLEGSGAEGKLMDDMSYEDIIKTLPFTPAEKITEADRTNDHRSTNRRLMESMFLIVKRNRDEAAWQFPQGKIQEGETLRQATERIIDRATGGVRHWFVSNAPIGHYCYAYPPELQKKRGQYGAKVFFYRCQLISGHMVLETKLYRDYAWIARDEVDQYFDKDFAEYAGELLPW